MHIYIYIYLYVYVHTCMYPHIYISILGGPGGLWGVPERSLGVLGASLKDPWGPISGNAEQNSVFQHFQGETFPETKGRPSREGGRGKGSETLPGLRGRSPASTRPEAMLASADIYINGSRSKRPCLAPSCQTGSVRLCWCCVGGRLLRQNLPPASRDVH